MIMSDEEPPEGMSEHYSDMAWQGHRRRQLEALGVDPDRLDAGDQG